MNDKETITPAQCRAARALIKWTQADLSSKSDVGLTAVCDFESEERKTYKRTLSAIRNALETAGVKFIEENGGGPGVRFKVAE